MEQTTFASLAFEKRKKRTRRERFLSEIEAAVPRTTWVAVIEPHYPKTGHYAVLLLYAAMVRSVGPGAGRRIV